MDELYTRAYGCFVRFECAEGVRDGRGDVFAGGTVVEVVVHEWGVAACAYHGRGDVEEDRC